MDEIAQARAFLQGVGQRNFKLVAKHINTAKYLEHNPQVTDGAAGLSSYIDSIPEGKEELRPVRVFREGDLVITQARGSIHGLKELFDVFRFEDGLIVEHWSFFSPVAGPNKSGHTQLDGPTEAVDLAKTEGNKKFIRGYYETIHLAERHDKMPEYISKESVVVHEPEATDGIEAFRELLKRVKGTRSIDEIALLIAQGDFVFIVAKGTHQKEPCLYIDLYRVENEKIVEHWGFPQDVPPKQEWKNSNGMV